MSWKGRHSRDWIKIGSWGDEYEVLHEVQSNTYGIFGVVQVGYDEEWMVFWRPNRNCTTDWKIKVMCEKIEVSYSHFPREEEIKYPTEEDAIAAIAHWQDNFEHPEKLKRYRPRDSQKTKLYRWEHIMAREIGPTTPDDGIDVLHHIHPHMHIHTFLNSVCDVLGEKKVELKFRSGGSSSFGGQYTGIQLLPCHCNHLVLLHELSHVLHGRWGNKTDGNKHQSHGREFVGIFMYFLIRFGGVDKSEIIRHANEHKIDFLLPTKFWEWEDSETQEKAA
jgi:hypothetical protein